MPSGRVIKEATLCDMDTIKSEVIREKLQTIFDFITQKIFMDSEEIKWEGFVIESFQLLSIEALNSISSMLVKSRMEEVDFTFSKNGSSKTIKLTGIKTSNLKKLQDYVSFLEGIDEEKMVTVDCSGKIIEMKSKNPQGDNNSVLIQTNDERNKKITASHKEYKLNAFKTFLKKLKNV